MKKIIAILAVASAATFAHAQGTVILQNVNPSFLVSTNATAVGGSIGVTTRTAGTFSYAVLIADFGGPVPSSDPLDAAWSGAVLTGVNWTLSAAGGIAGQGGGSGSAAAGWGAPTGPNYTDGTEKYFMIVGWSTSSASTWSAFSVLLAGNSVPYGSYWGKSAIGYGFSGGGPNSLLAPSLFGVSTAMPGGLTSGFQLNVVTPEPATIALAGLGGLSLLTLRRKK